MPAESGIKKIGLAALYDLRLTISGSEKADCTKDEILQLLDRIAVAKK